MRDKERVHDYRFMAEPNLPPLRLYTTATLPANVASDQIVNIDDLKMKLPELPSAKRQRLQRVHHLSLNHSSILVVSLFFVSLPEFKIYFCLWTCQHVMTCQMTNDVPASVYSVCVLILG